MLLYTRTTMAGRAIASCLAMLVATGCGESNNGPAAKDVVWSVKPAGDGRYQLLGTATYAKGNLGWYTPTITTLDSRGCQAAVEAPATHTIDTDAVGFGKASFQQTIKAPAPIASADLTIKFVSVSSDLSRPEILGQRQVYSGSATVDPSVKPAPTTATSCGKLAAKAAKRRPSKAELRERAKTDPDGADAEAIGQMSRNELVATAINSAGYLCARVTSLRPSGGAILADCVEYRSGQGRVRYRVDPAAGRVEPLD